MRGWLLRPAMAVFSLGCAGLVTLPSTLGRSTAPVSQSELNAVTCPTRQVCVAVGGAVTEQVRQQAVQSGEWRATALISTDGGAHWTLMALPHLPNLVLNAVSCTSPGQCSAVGATEHILDKRWQPAGPGALLLSGGRWQMVATPRTAGPLFGVACSLPTRCIAVGGRDVAGTLTLLPTTLLSTTGGRTWIQRYPGLRRGILYGLACATRALCVAAGANAYVAGGESRSGPVAIRSSNGGETWVPSSIGSSGGGGTLAVSCPASATCVGVGDIFVWCQCGTGTPGEYGRTWSSSDRGATYAVHVVAKDSGYVVSDLDAVSCWSPTSCETAGTAQEAKLPPTGLYYPILLPLSTSNKWQGPGRSGTLSSRLAPQWIYGLKCFSAASCVAVGQSYGDRAAIETSHSDTWSSRTP